MSVSHISVSTCLINSVFACVYAHVCDLQRREIVTGTVEPTDEECEWTSDREEEEELAVSSW